MLSDLINIVFPDLCVGCNGTLLKAEKYICTYCIRELPETHFHTQPGNDLEKTFWGRVPLEQAFAFLSFRKKGIVQSILHELKYGNNPDLGVLVGELYGTRLRESGLGYDVILAVPLHPSKEKSRGYNQSDCFARGLSHILKAEHCTGALRRIRSTETQTRKTREQRWDNVETVFEVSKPGLLAGKRVLLVDDVITTGATIEACAAGILQHTSRLSVAGIACVVNQ